MKPRLNIHPDYAFLGAFLAELPSRFSDLGYPIHEGRNTLRNIAAEGLRLTVKRYKRPDWVHRVIYGFLRRSKCRRAYDNGMALLARGFSTPQPVAWIERSTAGLLQDAYLVTLQSDFERFTDAANAFPEGDSVPVVEAFADFAISLHEAGVEHLDFNHTNILYRKDPATHRIVFQLIDINRMRFHDAPLARHLCVKNLHRLFCPAIAFLNILRVYAERRGWDRDEMLLRGIFMRLSFKQFKEQKHRFTRWLRRLFSHGDAK